MAKQYTKQFKEDAIEYVLTHPELTLTQCAKNLGVNGNTLHYWVSRKEQKGEVHRGSGNYDSDMAKELAHVKRELQDTKDALQILKKAIGILNE